MDESQRFLGEFAHADYQDEVYPDDEVLQSLSEEPSSFTTPEVESIIPNSFNGLTGENERLGDPLYSTFGYPSKLYYRDIIPFIESYTRENDVVLDPMCGAGSTGLACLATQRKGILNDGSPLAHFITANTCYPSSKDALQYGIRSIARRVKADIQSLYETPCTCCGSMNTATNIFHSDFYDCPNCGIHFPLYQNKTDEKSVYKCPNCSTRLKTSSTKIKQEHRTSRRKPVTVQYNCQNCSCGEKNHETEITDEIVDHWGSQMASIKEQYGNVWVPSDVDVVTGRWYTREGGWPGFDKDSAITDLFTDRNLLALGMINDALRTIEHPDIKSQLKFAFLASLIRCSNRMYTTSVVKTYYQVPSVGKVQNVWKVFERKVEQLQKSRDQLRQLTGLESPIDLPGRLRVYNRDATTLPTEANTVDYVFIDPPYGSQVGYYELNRFYSAWLPETKEPFDDEVIIPMETDDNPEYADKWGEMIQPVFAEAQRVLKPGRYMTVVFHTTAGEIWNQLREVLFNICDFRYIGYVNADRGTSIHTNRISDTNVKQGFLTVQKRTGEESITTTGSTLSEDELDELKHELTTHIDPNEEPDVRELYDEAIRIVHENELSRVPSREQVEKLVAELT